MRIISPFGTAGANDLVARLIGQWLSERFGQQFVIENRPGAGGTIGTEAAVRAPADGYTLLLVGTTQAINATLYDKLSFNFIRDIAPVAPIIRLANVLDVNLSVPAKTVPEFIAYAKANPGKINMASVGTGSTPHVTGELFKMMAGVNMVHVPYRSAGAALTDLISGQGHVYFGTIEIPRCSGLLPYRSVLSSVEARDPLVVKRRDFITLGGAAAAWPLAARAQQLTQKMLRVGTAQVLPRNRPQWLSFEQKLRELGYVEGSNLAIEYIDVDDRPESHGEAVRELVRRRADVIVAAGVEIALQSALREAGDTPIVMIAIDYDPLAKGYIKNLARPGGNVTGLVALQIELTRKRLQILKDAVPNMRGVTVYWDRFSVDQWQVVQGVAAPLGMPLHGIELRDPPYDYETALMKTLPEFRAAIIALSSAVMFPDRFRIAELAIRYKAASMAVFREYTQAGCLFSYGPSLVGMFSRAADYVARIGKGAKPADMPIEQPTKFDFMINLKTAKALGVTIPPGILAIADEVIE
jgi:putative tryptophan/tyrosine transport system substrate-binding protein